MRNWNINFHDDTNESHERTHHISIHDVLQPEWSAYSFQWKKKSNIFSGQGSVLSVPKQFIRSKVNLIEILWCSIHKRTAYSQQSITIETNHSMIPMNPIEVNMSHPRLHSISTTYIVIDERIIIRFHILLFLRSFVHDEQERPQQPRQFNFCSLNA